MNFLYKIPTLSPDEYFRIYIIYFRVPRIFQLSGISLFCKHVMGSFWYSRRHLWVVNAVGSLRRLFLVCFRNVRTHRLMTPLYYISSYSSPTQKCLHINPFIGFARICQPPFIIIPSFCIYDFMILSVWIKAAILKNLHAKDFFLKCAGSRRKV